MKNARDRVIGLPKSIEADFPRRKRAAEELLKRHGFDEPLIAAIAAPDKVTEVPTFERSVSRPLTPMLQARFDYAGSWRMGQDVWLSAGEMASYMKQEEILLHHRAKREHWEGSAPMIFSDDRLTLFGAAVDIPDHGTYLAWAAEVEEPEVWVYKGFDSHKFKNLEQYFT